MLYEVITGHVYPERQALARLQVFVLADVVPLAQFLDAD